MDLGSVEGLLIALLLIAPGALGDQLMRVVTVMPQPRSDFGRLLAALSWSTFGLASVELVNAWSTAGAFGDFLIVPITRGLAESSLGALGSRYLVFVAVAALAPPLARWVLRLRHVESLIGGRTLSEPTLARLFRYRPDSLSDSPYAEVVTEQGTFEGWVRWNSNESDEDAALILRDLCSNSVTLIPVKQIVALTLKDAAPD